MSNHDASEADGRVYELTTYIAAPGTPIIDPNTGQRGESLPGHMYYKISDGKTEDGYGFAPQGHGTPLGPGDVSPDDFKRYQDPVYARTIEITHDQYEKLKEFGEAGAKGQQTHFNLTYNSATNSCIDFTWGALNHAGLHQQLALPNGQSIPLRTADGQVLPETNIPALQSIQAPFPNSPHNHVETNPSPPGWAEKAEQARDNALDRWQDKAHDVLDDLKCAAFPKLPACPPGGASLDREHTLPDPRDPLQRNGPVAEPTTGDPWVDRAMVALNAGDTDALDRIGLEFVQSPEGQRMLEYGNQLYAQQQMEQQQMQEQMQTQQSPVMRR